MKDINISAPLRPWEGSLMAALARSWFPESCDLEKPTILSCEGHS